MQLNLSPIGFIESCFKEKFGIPRQPGLVTAARARLKLIAPYDREEAVRGLDGFSHIWLIFGFHGTAEQGWKPTVRPPRLGGNKRLGVFATRSTFRPNPLGLSVVRLSAVDTTAGVVLSLSGADLLDGTPVYDIKPYLPYADILPDASGGFAPDEPDQSMPIHFSDLALQQLAQARSAYPDLQVLIEQMLRYDPRPAYFGASERDKPFGVRLYEFDVKWRIEAGGALVLAVERV
ncbi:tRNA (N6-threonylcarbamoyladenosine(37)-N6)-methyltransferase TrmO [Chitinivorax tropicus]|nr:tRNA (N6-threonylcarbamoyladenosine(37)-N6)-methyltransferase TrmO [Chitinivorax tropicus]